MEVENNEERPEHPENDGECPWSVLELRDHDPAIFWSHVDRTGDGCWNWLGASNHGYGVHSGRRAHRIALMLSGVDPVGHYVCHRCDNKLCCNPAHLFLGTPRDNTQDCIAKGRFRGGKPARSNFPEATIARVVELATAGVMTKRDIARACGMGERNVYVILAQHRDNETRRKRGT